MIADAGKRYTLVPEETIPSKAKSVKSLTSFAKRSAQLAAGFVCAIALAAGVPTVAGAQVLTTDNVCGKTADARGITAENLPDIDATNALVMGKDGTVYYGRGADEQVKIASITKVMTAILTVENCKMDEKVTVSNAAATVGNSTAGLLEGDKLTVEQALRGLMIPSGNDAAIVLAEYVGKKIDPKTKDAEATFVKAMNERAKKLGCTGTLFENPHGLDFDEWAGDMHSTAHDVALMMQEAMKNDTIREVVASEDSWIEVTGADGTDHSHSMDTHNYLLGQDGNIGGKTGTSEKLDEYDENGQQVKDKIVSFVGVAPIDDPKYVVLVALDTPAYSENSEKYTVHGMYISGGLMAAPTVRDIFLDILPYLGVEPDYGSEDIRGVNFTVPDVIGMDETEAGELLAEKTITYRVVGTGSVVTDQLPVAGSQVPGNSQIILYMGAEKQATRVEVPDFIGCSVADVNYLASNAGLYVQAKGTDRTDVYVLAAYQDIDPGTEVDRGTTITVEFSSTGASD